MKTIYHDDEYEYDNWDDEGWNYDPDREECKRDRDRNWEDWSYKY